MKWGPAKGLTYWGGRLQGPIRSFDPQGVKEISRLTIHDQYATERMVSYSQTRYSVRSFVCRLLSTWTFELGTPELFSDFKSNLDATCLF
jgi:hypothetical protein